MAKGTAQGKAKGDGKGNGEGSRTKRAKAPASNKARSKRPLKATPTPAARAKAATGSAQAVLSARLKPEVTLQAQRDGALAACFNDYSIELGTFSPRAIEQAASLSEGLPLAFFAKADALAREVHQLTRRLAMFGLIEFPFAHRDAELFVIEPQTADFWPEPAKLNSADNIVLSRFAYLRRRGEDLVLESSRSDALFRVSAPAIAAALAILSVPQPVKKLRGLAHFPGDDLLGLLLDGKILFKVDRVREEGRRGEGDDDLVLWDFHDLLFHTRSTEGRHANPLGGVYPHVDHIAPLPAVRPPWRGEKIELTQFQAAQGDAVSPFVELLQARHSVRDYDEAHPISAAELATLLDRVARIRATWDSDDFGEDGPVVGYAARPYPSGGSAYELELYLAIDRCDGLARGFYHYDASAHTLVRLDVAQQQVDAMLGAACYAMDAEALPQILVTIAARFGRVSWKYSSLAYSLILKDVGVLTQTLYLAVTDLGLGGCAIGTGNIDQFATMTGLAFHVEGPVGHFALGRPAPQDGTSPATSPTPD
jgi:SagB-type dehydrogenase family enzyme